MKISIHFTALVLISFVFSCDDNSSHDMHKGNKDTTNTEQVKESKHDMSSMSGMDQKQTDHSEMLQLTTRQQLLAG